MCRHFLWYPADLTPLCCHLQELKGNIRVFCRVRPAAEAENGETSCELPASGDGGANSLNEG